MSSRSTILFVDDNEPLREAFARLLEREGYNVLRAGNSQEGLAALQGFAALPDLIISDIILPGPDSQEFFDRLTQVAETTPVLFISGYPRDMVEQHALGTTGADFLPKPFGVQELTAKVRELLGSQGPDAIG